MVTELSSSAARRAGTIAGLVALLSGGATALAAETPAPKGAATTGGGLASPLSGSSPWYAPTTAPLTAMDQPDLQPAADKPEVVITPVASLKQAWTDNVFLTRQSRKDDFITTVTPGVRADIETRKLALGLKYDLAYDQYANYDSLSGLRHDGLATLSSDLVDRTLFLDGRASVSERSTNPTGPRASGDRTSPLSTTRVIATSISPRLAHEFGSFALGEIQVGRDDIHNQSATAGDNSTAKSNTLADTGTNRARIEMRSGSAFTRLLWDYTSQFSQQHQSGSSNSDLNRNSHQIGAEYKVTDEFGLLATGGHDRISGMGIDSEKYGGMYYSGGLHWNPSPDLDARIGLGRRYAQTSFYARVDYKITPRTSLRLSRDSGVGTDATETLSNLNLVQRDALGNFIDPLTGLDASPAAQDFAFSNSVYRQTRSMAILTHKRDRDTLTLSGRLTERRTLVQGATTNDTITNVTNTPGSTTRAVTFDATWSHQLAPDLSSGVNGATSRTSSSTGGTSKITQGGLSLTYQLNPTLTSVARYAASVTTSEGTLATSSSQGTVVDNMLFVSLRKEF